MKEKVFSDWYHQTRDITARAGFDAAWQHQQAKVEELQNRVDAAQDALTELKEKSEALHHRWNILNDSVALAEAEMIDMCVKEIEQALKGEGQ